MLKAYIMRYKEYFHVAVGLIYKVIAYLSNALLIGNKKKGTAPILILHYCFIVAMTIIASVALYINGKIAYIDALFIGASSCTQAGLTTIDLVDLTTFQQVVVYIFSLLCNSLNVHTYIAISRFYLIRKKRQDIVEEANRQIQFKRISSFSEPQAKPSIANAVGGHEIKVLLDQGNKYQNLTIQDERPLSRSSTIVITQEAAAAAELTASAIVNAHLQGNRPAINIGKSRRSSTSSNSSDSSRIRPHLTSMTNNNLASAIVSDDDSDVEVIPPRHIAPKHRAYSFDENKFYNQSRRKSFLASKKSTVRFFKSFTFDKIFSNNLQFRKSFSRNSNRSELSLPYLSWQPTILRNSNFVNLTDQQHEELEGIEYRALRSLCVLLCCYIIFFQIIALLGYLTFIFTSSNARKKIEAVFLKPAWWAIFQSNSTYINLGLTLNPNNFVDFQRKPFILIYSCFLIAAGNTGFPILLRSIIWIIFIIIPITSPLKEVMAFLLDHPRRCFTLLFPRKPTLLLVLILVLLTSIDVFLFYVLDHNTAAVSSIPKGPRFASALFQAFSNRTAGFNVLNLADLRVAIQIAFMVMMYISVFPLAISIRRTNVLEEEALGIYYDEESHGIGSRLIGSHVRRQLSFDIWFLTLALFLISIIENTSLTDLEGSPNFDVWRILFEIISAYCCVGLSLGYPNTTASFSSQLSTLSKLIIVAVSIRGRHRGLPYSIDMALKFGHKPKSQNPIPRLRRASQE